MKTKRKNVNYICSFRIKKKIVFEETTTLPLFQFFKQQRNSKKRLTVHIPSKILLTSSSRLLGTRESSLYRGIVRYPRRSFNIHRIPRQADSSRRFRFDRSRAIWTRARLPAASQTMHLLRDRLPRGMFKQRSRATWRKRKDRQKLSVRQIGKWPLAEPFESPERNTLNTRKMGQLVSRNILVESERCELEMDTLSIRV